MTEINALPLSNSGMCIYCNGAHSIHWCYATDTLHLLTTQQFEYQLCSNCGVIFLSNPVHEDNLVSIYPQNYGPYNNPVDKTNLDLAIFNINVIKAFFYNVIGHVIMVIPGKHYKQPAILARSLPKQQCGQLLDFGCGSDIFLNQARSEGWKTIGMDFNSSVIDTIIASGHRGIQYTSDAVWDSIPDGSIDFIRMNHVIEHLYHPKTVLKHLYRKLRIGGELHIATPNPCGVSAKEFGNNWRGLDCPRHVVLYPPKVLQKFLLDELGFRAVESYFEKSTKDYVRSLGFQAFAAGKIKHSDAESLMHNRFLLKIYAGKLLLASFLKRSDRFHIFSIK